MSDLLREVREAWMDNRARTHYENCWRSHPGCVVALLSARVEELEAIIFRAFKPDYPTSDDIAALLDAFKGTADD